MKLNKIAALAMAGVMAVSMLAGCSGKGTGSDSKDPVDVNTSASSIVKALNDGQKATNKVKINFTSDSELDNALKRIVETYGVSVTKQNVEDGLKNLLGLENKNYMTGQTFMNAWSDYDGHKDSKDQTYVQVTILSPSGVLTGAPTEEYALNKAAANVNEAIAELATVSNDNTPTGTDYKNDDGKPNVNGDDKYFAYSYEGTASMVSVKQVDGSTNYFVVYVIEQTITEKTA